MVSVGVIEQVVSAASGLLPLPVGTSNGRMFLVAGTTKNWSFPPPDPLGIRPVRRCGCGSRRRRGSRHGRGSRRRSSRRGRGRRGRGRGRRERGVESDDVGGANRVRDRAPTELTKDVVSPARHGTFEDRA